MQTNGMAGRKVKIVEVGPRDGLQNEKQILTVEQKVDLIDGLSAAGLKVVETGSFVSPKWVPQMANSKEVFAKIKKFPGVSYPCLVPNEKGFEEALASGVEEIAIFASATESFSKKNLNCSIRESLNKYEKVTEAALKNHLRIRGYVSMVMGCPYEGEVDPDKVRQVVHTLFEMGCYEVSLGDTVGKGTPEKTRALLTELQSYPKDRIGLHFHDTFDKAIDNILEGVSMGYSIVDSSVGGLGGCPYSMKPVGNVCTENVVYALEGVGLTTGVDYKKLAEVGDKIVKLLDRQNLRIF